MPTKFMDVKGIAKYLGVSKETIYRLLYRNKIPSHRIGKLHVFDPEEVAKAVKKGKLS